MERQASKSLSLSAKEKELEGPFYSLRRHSFFFYYCETFFSGLDYGQRDFVFFLFGLFRDAGQKRR